MGFFMPLFGQDSIEQTGKHWVKRVRGAGSAKDHETVFELGLP